ncbi:response regulator transcription factor [bacterium]|nr:response regulator transcription factor [bacterium]
MKANSERTTVGIIDDHALFRASLTSLLTDNHQYEVIIESSNGKEFLEEVKIKSIPSLVLVDYEMPVMDGFETIKAVRKKYGESPMLIVLSMYEEKRIVDRMFDYGANGFVSKSSGAEILFDAIKQVQKSGFYLSPRITSIMMNERKNKKPMLSLVEQQIITLICDQKTNAEVAKALKLKRNTVNTYRTRILEKLSLHNTAGLVIYAIQHGLYNARNRPL